MVVTKVCPECEKPFPLPVGMTSFNCPHCGERLLVEMPAKTPYTAGQKIMIAGLVLVVLGILIPVLAAA